jgi:hypothetical protein
VWGTREFCERIQSTINALRCSYYDSTRCTPWPGWFKLHHHRGSGAALLTAQPPDTSCLRLVLMNVPGTQVAAVWLSWMKEVIITHNIDVGINGVSRVSPLLLLILLLLLKRKAKQSCLKFEIPFCWNWGLNEKSGWKRHTGKKLGDQISFLTFMDPHRISTTPLPPPPLPDLDLSYVCCYCCSLFD